MAAAAWEDSTLGPSEIEEWKMRLQHAHNQWRDAGYIPDSQNGSTESYSMMRYLDAYRGDFPPSLAGATEHADQMVGNITFSIINTMVAQISARNPDPIVRPLAGSAADGEARRRAWLNERMIEAQITEGKYKREADMTLLSAVLCGFGVVRHGYTPNEEYLDDNGNIIARHKNQGSDTPWIQFLRPWQIRIDPMVNDFAPDTEPRWCAFHNLYFRSQIERNPNLKFRDDLVPTHYQDLRLAEQRKKGAAGEGDANVMPMYEEWVIYDAEERRFFGISPGSSKLIRPEADWPFDWGQLPYSYLAFNRQLDSPFPIPFPRLFMDEQALYNRVLTIVNAIVSRVRRIIGVNQSALVDGQVELLTNPAAFAEYILTVSSPEQAIKDIGIGTIPGDLVGLLYMLKTQIREVLGVSQMDLGQRANVQTAAEATQIGAGSQVTRSRTQEHFESFWSNVIRVSNRTLLQSPSGRKRLVPIIGKENFAFLTEADRANGFIQIDPSELQGEFEYAVKLDSTLRLDPEVELSRLATGYNLMGGINSKLVNQRFYHERISELSGADPVQAVIGEQMAAATASIEQSQAAPASEPDAGMVSAAQQGLPDLRAIQGGA